MYLKQVIYLYMVMNANIYVCVLIYTHIHISKKKVFHVFLLNNLELHKATKIYIFS